MFFFFNKVFGNMDDETSNHQSLWSIIDIYPDVRRKTIGGSIERQRMVNGRWWVQHGCKQQAYRLPGCCNQRFFHISYGQMMGFWAANHLPYPRSWRSCPLNTGHFFCPQKTPQICLDLSRFQRCFFGWSDEQNIFRDNYYPLVNIQKAIENGH